jgi:two-component system phosphate regulon sensor histidine kinase PhoR
MSANRQPEPREIGGVLGRINRLGVASETFFSRLYRGISRRSQISDELSRTQQLLEQNRHQQRVLRRRDIEIERLNSILASINEGVIMQDIEGRIVVVNAAARALLGSQKNFWESELGTLFNAYNSLDTVDAELAPLGEPTRVQINNRILGAQLAAVADSQGQRLGTMIVLRDVTQDALADRLKDQFITAISHELRTPMAVIKGMSEVMLAAPTDAKPNRKLLETLSRNVDILDRMIVELLDISELVNGNFSIRQDTVDLATLIFHTVNGLAPETKRASLEIQTRVKGNGDYVITGDDQRLRWALGHLLQNSIYYTERNGRITVSVSRPNDRAVSIEVRDTGVGIADKDLPHIFKRFYRGEPRTAAGRLIDPRGLGQGLFIARTVTEAHGGHLSVNSQPGEGSIFTLVLPAA